MNPSPVSFGPKQSTGRTSSITVILFIKVPKIPSIEFGMSLINMNDGSCLFSPTTLRETVPQLDGTVHRNCASSSINCSWHSFTTLHWLFIYASKLLINSLVTMCCPHCGFTVPPGLGWWHDCKWATAMAQQHSATEGAQACLFTYSWNSLGK